MSRVDVIVVGGKLSCLLGRIPVEKSFTYRNLLTAIQRRYNMVNPHTRQFLSSFQQVRVFLLFFLTLC